MAVLNGAGSYSKQSITITPVYDRAAAVKYYTIDNGQWFSYDDGSTFAQKIAWANEVGLGGAMIWASDLGGVLVETVVVAYPSVGQLFTVANVGQIVRWAVRLNQNYCTSNAMSVSSLPARLVAKAFYASLNSDHLIDVRVLFPEKSSTPSSRPRYPVICSPRILCSCGNVSHRGAVVASADTPASRIMQAFGSTKSPEPLLVTAAGINAVKGRIVGHNAPFTIGKIEELAAAAVKDDSDEAVNNLLTAIRNTFALFEHFSDYRAVGQWNNMLQQVGLQCAHIEHVTGVTDLQKWWWIWAPDFFQGWATATIQAAASVYTEARMAGRSVKTNDVVVAALREFQSKVSLMRMPTMNADKTTITD
ncbi:hypothetical protein AnigIFM56816_004354 [Aspergillus niger]|nr:hypothetical protein AnigIFM56816_004354 [Aspergillus niger]